MREDPKKRGQLYVGTELGLMISPDDGTTWQPLTMNFPPVAVHDMVVKNNDLVIASHGRSFWVFDDLTPIREFAAGEAADHTLLPVQTTTRWNMSYNRGGNVGSMPNPPNGMVFHYWLKTKAKSVTLDVLDAKGAVVRTLKSKPEPASAGGEGGGRQADTLSVLQGLHRALWDLEHKGSEYIKDGQTDGGDVVTGPTAAPGTYTLRLTVDGKVLSQTAQLIADPRQSINAAELAKTHEFTLAVRDTISALTRTVLQLRTIKKQLGERADLLATGADTAKFSALVKAAKKLSATCDSVEGKLHNATAKISYDILAGKNNTGAKLYAVLATLYDAAKSDEAITQGMREVFAEEIKNFDAIRTEWRAVLAQDVETWNKQAKALDVPHVLVPTL